ncbi:hypothetical protein [Desulfovibrio ferrophilus]|uniref:Uncharacterized protein n=1 Tax=Desulfovibrio ferrophilus TaxID=241368 RepID=A0A2Z6B1G7_9BACT|nr:hypothetical protein [Desulfovibrio ferrophilus]BBD09298.1 uncharacterized protein DFE_2572 [Desulfovibrio ferrophilus]
MRIIIPAIIDPEEYLSGLPDLFHQLTVQAARTAIKATSLSESTLISVVYSELPAQIISEFKATGVEFVKAGEYDSVPALFHFLPHGSQLALDLIGAHPSATAPAAILNPRNPTLTCQDLTSALDQFSRTEAMYLLSARPPEDHPCQGKTLYALHAPFRPLHDGATLGGDSTGRQVVHIKSRLPAQTLLVLMWRGGKIILSQDTTGPDSRACFTLPSDFALPDSTRWGLITPTDAPGPARFLLPYVPIGATWDWDRSSTRVTDLRGQDITGRQDFPPLAQPDGSLSLFRAPLPQSPDQDLAHDLWRLPAEHALLIKDGLSLLRWQLLARNEQQAPDPKTTGRAPSP